MSTPRAGNSWLRHLLSSVYGLESPGANLAVHTPEDVPWPDLPGRCVLQLHWHPTPAFVARLGQSGFRVVTLARHPLDVLISILRFAPFNPETARWLGGEGGDERPILGKSPRDPEFLDYATGPRAAALLSITAEWWARPGVHRVRYEALVARPDETLGRLVADLGGADPGRIAGAIAANTRERLRDLGLGPHVWKGQPGLWRSLLTADEVARIADAHPAAFRVLGDPPEPSGLPDAARAAENWKAFAAD